jgi:hypothetical protein
MTDAVHRWIETLPRRWAIGGVAVGLAWIVVGVALVWSKPTIGGSAILTGIILIPFALLGLAWGWNERLSLREAAADGGEGVERLLAGEYHFTQTGKGAVCGGAYGAFFVAMQAIGLIPDRHNLLMTILTYALFGAAIGLIVGNVARFNLRRRLKRVSAVAGASTEPSPSSPAVLPGEPS